MALGVVLRAIHFSYPLVANKVTTCAVNMIASRNRDAGTVFDEMGSLLWPFSTAACLICVNKLVVRRTELPCERRSWTREYIRRVNYDSHK